jgi:hypothetical protein
LRHLTSTIGGMDPYSIDEEARDRRLAAIRAQRGTPERQAFIEQLALEKARIQREARVSSSGKKTPENSSDMYGHPWAEWFEMRDTGLDLIATAARDRGLTNYSDLWDGIGKALDRDLGNSWRQMPNLLGYISDHAYSQFKIIPTALVVEKEGDPHPGAGFFRLAAIMGVMLESDVPAVGESWTEMTDRQQAFWDASKEAVYDHYARPENT